MHSSLRGLAALLALSVMLAAAGTGHAQAVYVTPAPVVTYYTPPPAVVTPAPAVSYYYTPTVSYYSAPAPAVSYYTPAVSYYAAPAVSYYTPAVSYYAPAVSYYSPAVSYYPPSASVTTYRYGILPRRQVTVTNYYSPTYVVP
jgi:hypothetical protein